MSNVDIPAGRSVSDMVDNQKRTVLDGENLIVTGGRVFAPQGFIDQGVVVIKQGVIEYVGRADAMPAGLVPANTPTIYATGCIVAPGLLDVHLHGGGGCDVMDATIEALRTITHAHGRHGTTGLLAATITAPQEQLEEAAAVINQAMPLSRQPDWNGAQLLGLHMEGPYFSVKKCGAQNPAYIREPSQAEVERIISIIGPGLKHITIAPELPGAIELIGWLRQQGIRVSLGHTESSYEVAKQAIAAGADHATHTFNAMPTLHHREPGTVAAVLGDNIVTAEVIADGIHLHPGAMNLVYKAKGACLTCLVTDAMAAMDMPDGHYRLGELPVQVINGAARLENGSLAGSVLTLDRAVKNMVEMVGVPLEEAITMATYVPARQLNMLDQKGTLEVGKDGDLCIFGADLLCRHTIIAGRQLVM
jgi:N-acetylglucosamine-6-phosphate deacetylase